MESNRISLDDLPELMRILNEGGKEEQRYALMLLCPCRNRVYDREIWQIKLDFHWAWDYHIQRKIYFV